MKNKAIDEASAGSRQAVEVTYVYASIDKVSIGKQRPLEGDLTAHIRFVSSKIFKIRYTLKKSN